MNIDELRAKMQEYNLYRIEQDDYHEDGININFWTIRDDCYISMRETWSNLSNDFLEWLAANPKVPHMTNTNNPIDFPK